MGLLPRTLDIIKGRFARTIYGMALIGGCATIAAATLLNTEAAGNGVLWFALFGAYFSIINIVVFILSLNHINGKFYLFMASVLAISIFYNFHAIGVLGFENYESIYTATRASMYPFVAFIVVSIIYTGDEIDINTRGLLNLSFTISIISIYLKLSTIQPLSASAGDSNFEVPDVGIVGAFVYVLVFSGPQLAGIMTGIAIIGFERLYFRGVLGALVMLSSASSFIFMLNQYFETEYVRFWGAATVVLVIALTVFMLFFLFRFVPQHAELEAV